LKKRILSFLLAFVLICLMLPTTAFAADSHTHCICGKTHKNVGDHDAEVSTTFTAVTDQNGLQNAATNGGDIGNDAVVLSITGNGDKNNPFAKDSEALRIQVAEEAKYSGTYTGTLTFTIAVNTAENN